MWWEWFSGPVLVQLLVTGHVPPVVIRNAPSQRDYQCLCTWPVHACRGAPTTGLVHILINNNIFLLKCNYLINTNRICYDCDNNGYYAYFNNSNTHFLM